MADIDHEDEDLVAADYDLLDGGSARSTIAGRSSAKSHFNLFLASKLLPPYDKLSEAAFCDVKSFQYFGTYLCTHAKKSNGDLIMSGTAVQYLSVVKELAAKTFPKNEMWNQNNFDWYPLLRVNVEKQ